MACDSDTDDNQFREDVIGCEEALAHLDECCPERVSARVKCIYYFHRNEGCLGPDSVERLEPELEVGESRCIRDTSCIRLRDIGLCNYGRPVGNGNVERPQCR